MSRHSVESRRRTGVVFVVLVVGIVISALLALGLIYMGRMHPRS
jgi:hypothetical protein